MSWMQKLCEVYDAGERMNKTKNYTVAPVLLPLYHGTQQAQIELTITMQGELVRGSAHAITDKALMETILPVTEKSASRTSSPEPMPLFDKLAYIAGDYDRYFPPEKERKIAPHQLYLTALRDWCASPFVHEYVRAWLAYAEKGTLVGDLVAEGIFTQGEDGMIATKWAGGGKPEDAFVRYSVQTQDAAIHHAWLKPEIGEGFISYQRSLPAAVDICYATGMAMPTSTTSPKFIRYPGDGAKLISANDMSGFTFRGRFDTPQEALSLGRDTTEKAHAALKWLIRKQGYRNGDQVVLAFGTGPEKLPPVALDTVAMVEDDSLNSIGEYPRELLLSTKESISCMLSKAIRSLSGRLPDATDAVVMGLDSATPGRMAIFYYREIGAKDYLARIEEWHTTCTWRHTYRWLQDGHDDNGKAKGKYIAFEGAPSLLDIVLATYGEKASDKLKKSALERLLPCVVDRARLPRDIVNMLVRRATQRAQLSGYEREKALTIACALLKKFYNDQKQEVWTMALQPEVNDRSYLFGRAWAYAEAIERYALSLQKENRDTNAERLMVAFPKHPMSSWGILMERLNPYKRKLGGRGKKYSDGMDEVIDRLQIEGYTNQPLNDLYLLGYASQRHQFYLDRQANGASEPELNDADDTAQEEE